VVAAIDLDGWIDAGGMDGTFRGEWPRQVGSRDYARHHERGRYTCSDHTLLLKSLFEGMGIAYADMEYLKTDTDSMLDFSVNSEHGALVLRDDDGQDYVFDPWKMAVDNVAARQAEVEKLSLGNPDQLAKLIKISAEQWCAYDGAAGSIWNGMGAEEWGKKMRAIGYKRFSCDNGSNW
jgi:hypothetical protein